MSPDLDHVVHQANRAATQLRRLPLRRRADWLDALAEALERSADTLVPVAMSESHLPEARLRGELTRTAFQLRLLGEEVRSGEVLDVTIDHADPDWGMGPRPDLRRMNVPLGVVAVFGASNFPFAFSVLGGDSAAALAAGCAVVHKGHEAHPRLARMTAELVHQTLDQLGAPEGTFSLISERSAGTELVSHPLVDAVAFTGSARAGQALAELIGERPRPIPFYGELGSTNPVFVTAAAWSARSDQIAEGFCDSLGLGAGQFCTNPGVLVVPQDSGAIEEIAATARTRTGAPMLTETIRNGFADAFRRVQDRDAVSTVLDGSQPDSPALSVLTISAEAALADPTILGQEMFGPAGLLVGCRDQSEMLAVAEALDGQLTATIHAEPADDVADLAELLSMKAGRVLWNGWPTGVTVSHAQQHGGPFPATTAAGTTSVGTAAVRRFVRPVAYQDFPPDRLPEALREENPLDLRRRVDGAWQPAPPPRP